MLCVSKTLLGSALALILTVQLGHAQTADEDIVTQAEVTYPKNKIGALVMPKTVAATWSLNGVDFNFHSNNLGYGFAYEWMSNSRLTIGLEYTHAQLKLDSTQVGSGANVRNFNSSTADYDLYFAKASYCFLSSANFFQQFCPGVDIGNDAYPVLSFTTNNSVKIDRLQDIVVGLNLTYKSPITNKVLFRSTFGYNYGLGVLRADTVTSKFNSSYYLKLGGEWEFHSHHGIGVDVVWHNRNAKMSQRSMVDTWTTKSTELGLRLAYAFTL